MALYCMGVMCSKPGGGTSQYFFTFFFFSRCGERLLGGTEGKIKINVSQISLINSELLDPMMGHVFKNILQNLIYKTYTHDGKGNRRDRNSIQADINTMRQKYTESEAGH